MWGRERIQAQFVPLLYHADCINVDIFASCKKFCFPKNECGGQIGYKHNLFYSLLPSIDCVCDIGILHGLCNDKKTNREETRIKDTLQSKRKGDSTNWSPVANYWRLACLVRIRILPKKSQSYNVQLCALLQYTNIVLIRCEYIAILHLKAIVQCTSATNFQCSANTV